MKTPEDVCRAYADADVRLTVSTLDDGMVLIEGDEMSLEFLGHLILRQARFGKDCGFQLSPSGAGRSHFAAGAERGIYLHRIPCTHKPKTGKNQDGTEQARGG